jgi:hypothetical protein
MSHCFVNHHVTGHLVFVRVLNKGTVKQWCGMCKDG